MRGMTTRAAAAPLWFSMIWVGYEIAWSLVGVPRALGPLLGLVVSAFVTIDPLGLFWPRAARSDTAAQGLTATGIR